MMLLILCFMFKINLIQNVSNITQYKTIKSVHTLQISSIDILSQSKLIMSGSFDKTSKIIHLQSQQLQHEQTYNNFVSEVRINGKDRHFWALTYSSVISVLNPYNYGQTMSSSTTAYPNSGSGEGIRFNKAGTIAYICGYSGSNPPIIHRYNAQTKTQILPNIVTDFLSYNQINVIVLIDDTYIAAIDDQASPSKIKIYQISTQMKVQQIDISDFQLTYMDYDSKTETLFVASKGYFISSFVKNPSTGLFENSTTQSLNSFGTGLPTQMVVFQSYLFAVVDEELVEFEIGLSGELTYNQKFALNDTGSSISIDYPFLVVGQQNGDISVFRLLDNPLPPTGPPLWVIIVCSLFMFGIVSSIIAILVWSKFQSPNNQILTQKSQKIEDLNIHTNQQNPQQWIFKKQRQKGSKCIAQTEENLKRQKKRTYIAGGKLLPFQKNNQVNVRSLEFSECQYQLSSNHHNQSKGEIIMNKNRDMNSSSSRQTERQSKEERQTQSKSYNRYGEQLCGKIEMRKDYDEYVNY